MIPRRRIIPLVLILAATLATFATVVRNEFVLWDDPDTISQNPHLNPPSWGGIAYYFTHGDPGLFAPLTYAMWSGLSAISRSAVTFHLANVCLHAAAAVTVFVLLRALLGRTRHVGADAGAIVGALLFALHPLQVETVAWATAGKDLLSGLLSLLAIWQYLRFCTQRSRAGYAASIVLLALALLAKPSAVVTPLIMLTLDRLVAGRDWRRVFVSIVPMLLIVVPFVVLAQIFQIPQAQLAPVAPWQRPLVACDAISFYLAKLFVPHPLTIDYARTPASVLQHGAMPWLACLPPLALLALAIWARRRAPLVTAGIVIFVLALLPVLGLVPFMFQIHSTVADHYMYLPMLGVAMVAGWLVARFSMPIAYAASGAILAALAAVSMHQTQYWRDSVRLFAHAADVTPDVASVQGNYGRALATAGRLEDAIPHFQAAARIAPNSREAQMLLAQAYVYSNQFEQAIEPASRAIELARRQGQTATAWEHVLLGKALAGSGQLEQAQQQFLLAEQIKPDDQGIAAELQRIQNRLREQKK